MKVYQNIECGNIHFTIKEMLAEAREMYDLDDDTNCVTIWDYYREIEICNERN